MQKYTFLGELTSKQYTFLGGTFKQIQHFSWGTYKQYPYRSNHSAHVFMSKTSSYPPCKYRTKSKNMLQNKN